jgi:hypothetical protein
MAYVMRPVLQIPAGPPAMILRSSRDLFKDRHRRLRVVPAMALPITGDEGENCHDGPC